MLRITIPSKEQFDEVNQAFIFVKGATLSLEHSLVSLSKWESKWHKPFLSKDEKSIEETIDYIRCMTITQNVDPLIYNNLTRENVEAVNAYIENKMTATWFSEDNTRSVNRDVITSERIYYWMIALNIPFECQKWHLNRLLTLIRVCNIENQPKKNMSKGEIMRRNTDLNAARRKAMNTKG